MDNFVGSLRCKYATKQQLHCWIRARSTGTLKAFADVSPAGFVLSCFCRYRCTESLLRRPVAVMRKTDREKARAERDVWLFLGERSYPCQASGELTQPRRLGVLPVFSGPVNPAALPADGPTVRGFGKVSSSRWPPFLWLSGGKGGNYAVGIKWE